MEIREIIGKLTLEEKAGLCSGADFWRTKAVERLGIPRMMVSDGPHGLRKQRDEGDHVGINDSIEAVCFPTGVTAAASFDRQLMREMGESLGEACRAENLGVLLGPAVNIKRSPLCGRNFEYFSEDPYLSGEMAAAQIKGIQSRGVGTSIKHYLANNQEHRRLSSDSRVDERTLREIYLPAFEKAVREADPWTVMCSYNRVNGTYASEHHRFLTELLRGEWGFEGFVVSDWGAVNDRVEGLKAGLDLEMPSSGGVNDRRIVEAVRDGKLDEAILDKAVERILRVVDMYERNRRPGAVFDREEQHRQARRAAGESMVLLKNSLKTGAPLLPLNKRGRIAFIGEFARNPRFQGGGSSHINCFKVDNALDSAREILGLSSAGSLGESPAGGGIGEGAELVFARGFSLDYHGTDGVNRKLRDEAVKLARDADAAVVFAGLPDSYESEGYDRRHMRLPESHDRLIHEVAGVQPGTVVVLHNGSPVEMPWIDDAGAVLEAYLGGSAGGAAAADILFGDVNPGGRLAETFPRRLEDNPSHLYYFGEKDRVEYREGIFVGYRYYDKKNMEVLFPFGHGLSYTEFSYGELTVSRETISAGEPLAVSIDITNTGAVFGRETVQLYVAPPRGDVIRPIKELKGFEKADLEPGETRSVGFILDRRSFAYFSMEIDDWFVESGEYTLLAGSSSRDIRSRARVMVESGDRIPVTCGMNTLVGDLLDEPEKAAKIQGMLKTMEQRFSSGDEGENTPGDEAVTQEMRRAILNAMPLRNFVNFGGGMSFDELEALIDDLNRRPD